MILASIFQNFQGANVERTEKLKNGSKILRAVYTEKLRVLTRVYNISGIFRILILRVPSVNRIFLLRLLTAGAISLFLNITGAIAPVLNTPLPCHILKLIN